uniref:Uncharacterized protein n=1 Tax=Kalanchoe fedtschenkoi TaxID=63787 RepID=A0A7N0T1F7_KALFE
MQCSKEEALVRLFYNVSSSSTLLLLLYHFSSILISNLLSSLSDRLPFFNRLWYEPDNTGFSNEEEEEEEEKEEVEYGYFYEEGNDDLVADVIDGGDSLLFLPCHDAYDDEKPVVNFHEEKNDEEYFQRSYLQEEYEGTEESVFEDDDESSEQQISSQQYDYSQASESEYNEEYSAHDEDVQKTYVDSDFLPDQNSDEHSEDMASGLVNEWSSDVESQQDHMNEDDEREEEIEAEESHENAFVEEEKFLVFQPPKADTIKKANEPKRYHESENVIEETIFGDSCTNASTSKSSSEWRSSIFCRDSVSGTEDPFSSSSRRSCPKWESYAVFQKYDEEMLFFDRISAQKLHETESLRSIQSRPRSVSDRIVYKLTNKRPSQIYRRSYQELEAAYIAQICLTWEALNWNYTKFRAMRASRKGDTDPGCPAHVAQQFQQFQVLLQRYIENEPFEHGKRPEIYARIRISAPKLLQVPEYRDSGEEQKGDGFKSRISSPSFLMIMEEGIRTFMNFLKGDKEKHCKIIAAFFKKTKRGLVDPSLLNIIKKSNQKKKMKLKELRRPRNCLRKVKLKADEEMEIVMGLIDLKVVSRVLRMADLHPEQLHWCEEKMGKVKIWQGKLQRDSSPLFFPASSH